jgi:glycosyltransferase involved in cell wall biosynthesis
MNKVLILTYYWPPSGGAGVQRWLKFTKYLPESGWQPFILTVSPEYSSYPFIDASLEKEVPPEAKVIKTKAINYFSFYSKDPSKIPSGGFANNPGKGIKNKISRFIRGNFFIPDPRIGWNRYALKEASSIIRRENIKYIITTSPPHSTQLIGLRLKKLFPKITWIADLRDEWTDIYYYELFYPMFISRAIDINYEKKVLRNADQIITVGPNLAKTFISKVEGLNNKTHILTNGYDDADFEGVDLQFPDRFTITYVGTLSEVYPIDNFLSALAGIEKRGNDFLFRFVGSISNEIKSKINSYISTDKTEFIPYTDHSSVVKFMANTSLLLLVIPDYKKDFAHTPGKVFEYIATRKPVLYIGPAEGDAANHLKLCGQKGIFSGKDSSEIAEYIIENMETAEPLLFMPHPEYSRRVLTQNLVRILEGN